MLFKKKKNQVNLYEDEYSMRLNAFLDARSHLRDRVEQVLTARHAVEIYPEGPDKKQAEKDFETAQFRLICSIGNVDARKWELFDYWDKHSEEISRDRHWVDPHEYKTDSHTLVEWAIKDYYHK